MAATPAVVSRLAEIDVRDEEYTAFLAQQEAATPFHLPSWSEVIASCYGFRPSVLCMRDQSGEIYAASPGVHVGGRLRGRRWVSLPFTDACPPLATDAVAAEVFAAELDQHRRQAGLTGIEIRGEVPGDAGNRCSVGYRHVIPLTTDEDEVFRRLRRDVRYRVKRARREGVVVRREPNLGSAYSGFWRLHCATRRKLGVPVQPRAFLDAIWREMIERDSGYVLSAYWQSRPVASAVFLEDGSTVVYKLSASEPRFIRLGGPTAVLWEGIRIACETGQARMDLGKTELGHDGLRDFKRAWGSEETPLAYTYFGKGSPTASRTEGGVGQIIRRSPAFVARTIGRFAYRWTA
jgi:CelD/BcsL family acetyltransferase involved in cellulose biosynthesis